MRAENHTIQVVKYSGDTVYWNTMEKSALNPFPLSLSTIVRSSIILSIVVFLTIVPSFRFAFFFNLLPMCAIGFLIILVFRFKRHQPVILLLSLITLLALFFHLYNCIRFGVNFAFDSKEYWTLAQSIASGNGLGGAMYRPPFYPALVAMFIIFGDHSGLFLIVFQHALLISCVPGIYAVGRMFRFSQQASCIAAALVAFNSLLMQAAGFIMTEVVFLTLALACVAALKRLYDRPSIALSVISGSAFAASTYCRQLLFPVLLGGLLLLVIKKGKRGLFLASIALLTYFCAISPWCLRNYKLSGHYAMSANFGTVAFTKASTFDCLDRQGKYYRRIEKPLENVLHDLSLTNFSSPIVPEDDWQTNRIPHVLLDSLRIHHYYSYAQASSLLGKTAIEGFTKYPMRYVSSIVKSFSTLLFEHHDMYPKANDFFPIVTSGSTTFFKRISRGAVYVSGYVFLLFPLALLFRSNRRRALLMPFFIVCLMYLATAALQIGLTRYTIPWEPFKALCAAWVVETVLLSSKLFKINSSRAKPQSKSTSLFF
jgi:hypothetical protein